MSTRFTVIAVTSMVGIGKASKSHYAMYNMTYLSDFESFTQTDKQTGEILTDRQGAGFVVGELPVSQAFFPRLKAFFSNEIAIKRSPMLIDFETSVRPRGRNSETVIVDFSDSFKSKYPSLKAETTA